MSLPFLGQASHLGGTDILPKLVVCTRAPPKIDWGVGEGRGAESGYSTPSYARAVIRPPEPNKKLSLQNGKCSFGG